MTAVFSNCRGYRYRLDREIGEGPPIAFLLHNPSTAGETADDPTSRRGIGFAKSFGFGRLIFINPWARVATNPRELWLAEDPVGPENDNHIAGALREVRLENGRVVGAWGRVSPPARRRSDVVERLKRVLDIVSESDLDVFAFGINSDGSPKHPLYLSKDATLSIWKGRDSHRL